MASENTFLHFDSWVKNIYTNIFLGVLMEKRQLFQPVCHCSQM